jgi:hypothetical protein
MWRCRLHASRPASDCPLLNERAKRPTDHAERCLGHVIGGVGETYDRWEFRDQKAAAYEALAGLIGGIVNPADNVRTIGERRPRRRGGEHEQDQAFACCGPEDNIGSRREGPQGLRRRRSAHAAKD